MITNLDRLEELLSKATPTPWGMVTHMGIPGEGTVYGIRFDVGYSAEGLGQHESRLIAEAMNALPDLIAELREQATIIDKLKAELVDERAARSYYEADISFSTWHEFKSNPSAKGLVDGYLDDAKLHLRVKFPDLFKEAER